MDEDACGGCGMGYKYHQRGPNYRTSCTWMPATADSTYFSDGRRNPAALPFANYNPRYMRYCYAQGSRTPDEQAAKDLQEFPGACMLGFVVWNTAQLARYAAVDPKAFFWDEGGRNPRILNHEAYDAWLAEQFPTPKESV